MQIEIIAPVIIATFASLLSTLIALFKKREEVYRHAKEREHLRKRVSEIGIDLGFVRFTQQLSKDVGNIDPDRVVEQIESRVMQKLQSLPQESEDSVRSIIQGELDSFKSRLENIEKRFPDESKIEKISSINDALLSERIDQLKERLDQAETKILTRWDVALVVSAVIGGISFVVAATYAVIQHFGATAVTG